MSSKVDMFDIYFGNFSGPAFQNIRKETYGEDIGQFCWVTADEYRDFIKYLNIETDDNVLDIASGSGGPAIFLSRETGAFVYGIDINEKAVATARILAERENLSSRLDFRQADAKEDLPFDHSKFQAVVCLDSIQNIGYRLQLLRESYRVIKPGGQILYTDTHLITGIITFNEIAQRVNVKMHFDFTPPGENERLLEAAGFNLEISKDATENMALISKRMHDARRKYHNELMLVEEEETFENTQRFLLSLHVLASERRLSRFVYVANKPNEPQNNSRSPKAA
jgi:ubiquinone/menaquinone biosynthesis C-methylase UbiE